MRTSGGERGQATVEFVALIPLLVLLGFVLWQAAVAGQAVWLAGSAARAAARAEALGDDPAPAARDVLPPRLEDGLRVEKRDGGGVTVTLRIPSVVGSGGVGTTTGRARFVPQAP
jgi:TadE-like protein